ncbi:hypothetical protein A2154_04210 [Candidatus Gottesmanbacteria bacterium RBG_16_43_7]|uniref:Fimbrial assembly protein n=1 Tax=Candidatus Gottesmanbacteria bacterium RBG_16_43_7 TaxID=1798373 RepID=A0A1F5Z9I5_9BACT|nr:MAG: hypothetical protein A2154_04210 [Candidatus Gottesmanbacteria bacterium RBG_16_43_7]
MPANEVSVNLLGTDGEDSPINRIVNWAITIGRYIMITTEIVVLLAFVSRFSLDRKLTDLNESIEQKKVIIEANRQFEQDFKSLQSDLNQVDDIMKKQVKPLTLLTSVKTLLPPDAYLENLSINNNTVSANVTIGTTDSFAVFINNLQAIGLFEDIQLNEIKKNPLKGIVFQFNATTELPKPAQKPLEAPTSPEATP